jgi:hypothetical protein
MNNSGMTNFPFSSAISPGWPSSCYFRQFPLSTKFPIGDWPHLCHVQRAAILGDQCFLLIVESDYRNSDFGAVLVADEGWDCYRDYDHTVGWFVLFS